jgi:SRSO17 transposase
LPEVAAFLAPYAPLFRNRQSWRSVERYLTGLLTDLPRKNCDTMWDPLVLDQARVQHLVARSPAGGVLLLDDTGLPKQGNASVGVAWQYSGTLGKLGNCQIVVSAEYVEDDPAARRPVHWPVSA